MGKCELINSYLGYRYLYSCSGQFYCCHPNPKDLLAAFSRMIPLFSYVCTSGKVFAFGLENNWRDTCLRAHTVHPSQTAGLPNLCVACPLLARLSITAGCLLDRLHASLGFLSFALHLNIFLSGCAPVARFLKLRLCSPGSSPTADALPFPGALG